MNFFDILKSLLFDKKKEERPDADTLQSFTPYMINRWLSFYDKTKAVFVNETLNKFSSIFDNKEDQYELYSNLIPRSKFKRISYTKKKKEVTEEDENIGVLSKNNML
jgi:hypothetical protein